MELGSRPARETAKVPDNQSGAPGAGERSSLEAFARSLVPLHVSQLMLNREGL